MFSPTADQLKTLAQIGASYRFRHNAPQYELDERTQKAVPRTTGYCECIIIDLATANDPEHRGEYAAARGDDEPDALAKALSIAVTAPKPLTASQRATAAIVKAETDKALAEKDAEIAALKAKLAAAEPPFDGGVPTRPKGK
jgi:hypothetical protein